MHPGRARRGRESLSVLRSPDGAIVRGFGTTRGGRRTTFLCMYSLIIREGPDGAAIMVRFRNSPTGLLAMKGFETTQEILRRSADDLPKLPEGPWRGELRLSS